MNTGQHADVRTRAQQARRAAKALAQLDGKKRSSMLRGLAERLADEQTRAELAAVNAEDVRKGEAALERGELSAALVARLSLTEAKLDSLCDGIRQLADAPELVGRTQLLRELDEGLVLERVGAPLGVLGVVFEARPDAVPQICGLGLKSGNAVLLKGGSEALGTNRALIALVHEVLREHDLDPAALTLLEDRAAFAQMLQLDEEVDLIIARGSSAFVSHVQATTAIPVMGHAEGLCHVLLHGAADPTMAERIVVDAKCGYPAACNAVETLLWLPGAQRSLGACVSSLRERGVEVRVDATTRHALGTAAEGLPGTSEDDWGTEYGDLVLSIRGLNDLDEALDHIARWGSGHTEAIVTEDSAAAARFLAEVDAACVFHNASTRFADGYRFGLGAEVGISTGKLHARGPVGVEGLLTTRWLVRGQGQVASDYGSQGRAFTHRDLDDEG